jgi:fructose-1,6-bisphosphatase/inositol monophosphatase family enzyme
MDGPSGGQDEIRQWLTEAERLVSQAGAVALAAFKNPDVVEVKEHGDPVTQTDLAVQRLVVDAIRRLHPEHGILSEEMDDDRGDAEYVWVLDPIDGTKHFVRGIPLYGVSLGLQHKGRTVLGAVHLPATGQLFSGAEGVGASLDGEPIHCSTAEELSDAMVSMVMPTSETPAPALARHMAIMSELLASAFRVRSFGACSVELCLCAQGAVDIFVSTTERLKCYDYVGGEAIVRAAGGDVRVVSGFLLAGPKALCDKIEQILRRHGT